MPLPGVHVNSGAVRQRITIDVYADAVAEFNFTADATLHGSILVSDPTKGGNSGLLLSCVRFPSPRPVVAGQKGQLIAGITYVPTNVI